MRLDRCGWSALLILILAAPADSQQPATGQPSAQGKIVALNGRVEHTPAVREQWNTARMFQPLLAAERVRTLEASRAAILFIDETQVKLNAGAVLTIREVRSTGGASTSLDLSKGEAWFRTKNPKSGLTIQTPAAAAAVRGTEINLRIGPADQTVLTVVEGAAEFSNAQGAILVNAGEEGTAVPGQAPTKRVILNPEDAVQWALYYPAQVAWRDLPSAAVAGSAAGGFERLRAGDSAGALQVFEPAAGSDVWSRIGSSMAHLAAGNTDRARTVLGQPEAGAGDTAWRAQLAAVLLAAGDIDGARREIDAVLAQDASALRPLVLLSSLELRRNRPAEARAAAERALTAHPDSVGALIAASEAAQSRFDLRAAREYLDRAIALDPRDVHALVNRARIRFGTDDTNGARADADRAAAVAPDDAQVRSLRGFINLAEGNAFAARTDFEAAARTDPEFGEPHLGLGLVYFRQGRIDDGLLEMLTATLLEPKVALYQSYLGKAYYQSRRFPEALSALASAKRLDPRDPTPWLYSSLYLRDQNRQVDALNELRHAIALNDHRAVYRGRLLLDRDLATKNVSLAEIYRQLGFEAWGAYEALNSLEVDVTNASAHLFLAETYGRLPDRTEALSSELLQYFLYAPVNRNSFNSFAEYTALLEQPRRQFTVSSETGSRERASGTLNHRFGNERYAHTAFVTAARQEGPRLTQEDERVQAFYQGKLAVGRRTDTFFSVSLVRDDAGADVTAPGVFVSETGPPVLLRRFVTPDPTITSRFHDTEASVGMKHQWKPGSALTAAARYNDLDTRNERPRSTNSVCGGFDVSAAGGISSGHRENPQRTFDVQVQQASRLGRHQLIVGQQFVTIDKNLRCVERTDFPLAGRTFNFAFDTLGDDAASLTYARDEMQLTRWLHASLGLAYQRLTYDDLGIESRTRFELDEWSPRLGLSARLTPNTVFRAAAFRHLTTHQLGSTVAPATVAGFVVARNDFPTARRKELNLSLEHSGGRAFVAVHGFARVSRVPVLAAGGFVPEADASGTGAAVYANWIASRRVTFFADDQLVRFNAGSFDRYDNLARVGINTIHPSGIFVRVTGSHIIQRFTNTTLTGVPRANFVLADLDVSYEFAGKRGLASLVVSNAFDRNFAAVIEGLSIDRFLPDRRVRLTLRWRVW